MADVAQSPQQQRAHSRQGSASGAATGSPNSSRPSSPSQQPFVEAAAAGGGDADAVQSLTLTPVDNVCEGSAAASLTTPAAAAAVTVSAALHSERTHWQLVMQELLMVWAHRMGAAAPAAAPPSAIETPGGPQPVQQHTASEAAVQPPEADSVPCLSRRSSSSDIGSTGVSVSSSSSGGCVGLALCECADAVSLAVGHSSTEPVPVEPVLLATQGEGVGCVRVAAACHT